MSSFLAFGSDILGSPTINNVSNAGQDNAGQVMVSGGSQPFSDQMIVEIDVDNVMANGEFSGATIVTAITVYANQADYLNGIPLYSYAPQNAGQSVAIQDSPDRIGDTYIRFNSSILQSTDPGAPSLQELFIAPGSNIANSTPATFDHHTDVDYDNDGSIATGTIEDGNGYFNTNNSQAICFAQGTLVQTPAGEIAIEALRVGDKVLTADNGPQPIEWIGTRHVNRLQLLASPSLRPVLIPTGAFGANRPTFVSRQHALAMPDGKLVRAGRAVRLPRSGLRVANGVRQITYHHLLLPTHEVIFANGLPAESFYPGPHALKAITPKQWQTLCTLEPAMALVRSGVQTPMQGYGAPARPYLA